MNILERPGINALWAKTVKSDFSPKQIGYNSEDAHNSRERIAYFALHGKLEYVGDGSKNDPFAPGGRYHGDYLHWNGRLKRELSSYGIHLTGLLEVKCIKDGAPFDRKLALAAFASVYTSEMITSANSQKSGRRIKRIAFTALGVVIGCKDQALKLARLQLAAIPKGHFRTFSMGVRDMFGGDTPAYQCMAHILADYLDAPLLEQTDVFLKEPYYPALFAHWREPDLDILTPVLLAACDAHTHRCCQLCEFTSMGGWKRFPIEILLVFKLREMLGLPNPVLDHPLMNSPLGKLPEEIAFEEVEHASDEPMLDTMFRLLQRIKQEGYDDEAIYVQACQELGLT